VPKLAGLTIKQAKRKLAKAHCRLGKVTRKRSAKRRGRVIAQKPKRGTLRNGAGVNVVVSRGR
jgi:beta-lactam-binding protein with PASTA domain